jgi:hypothetical protein
MRILLCSPSLRSKWVLNYNQQDKERSFYGHLDYRHNRLYHCSNNRDNLPLLCDEPEKIGRFI